MKNASADFKVLIAHVELAKARFSHGEDIGIDFHNKIDAWSKMETVFRNQIQILRDSKTTDGPRRSRPKKSNQDLKTLVYSIREKID